MRNLFKNSFKIIDLSRTLSNNTPVFPGDIAPQISSAFTIEKNGFNEKKLFLYLHTGTHVDAPYHVLKSGKASDKFGLD